MDTGRRAHLLSCNCMASQERQGYAEVLLAMEIEEMRRQAREELVLRDEQISQLKDMLASAVRERDKALECCQKLATGKTLLQKQISGKSSNNSLTSSDCDEISIVSSSPHVTTTSSSSELLGHQHHRPQDDVKEFPAVTINKPLPEKGRLLQAVIQAGPLLQNLLLAGPLPRWRHPPPPVDACQIPPSPVAADIIDMRRNVQEPLSTGDVGSLMSPRKRAFCNDDSDSGSELKYQRVILQ